MSPEFGISPSLAPLGSTSGRTSGVLIIGNNHIYLFDVRKPSKKDLKRASDQMDEDDDSGSTKSLSSKKTAKRRKGRSVVDWPWGEISAWVSGLHNLLLPTFSCHWFHPLGGVELIRTGSLWETSWAGWPC
jgi:hypothetical protein